MQQINFFYHLNCFLYLMQIVLDHISLHRKILLHEKYWKQRGIKGIWLSTANVIACSEKWSLKVVKINWSNMEMNSKCMITKHFHSTYRPLDFLLLSPQFIKSEVPLQRRFITNCKLFESGSSCLFLSIFSFILQTAEFVLKFISEVPVSFQT